MDLCPSPPYVSMSSGPFDLNFLPHPNVWTWQGNFTGKQTRVYMLLPIIFIHSLKFSCPFFYFDRFIVIHKKSISLPFLFHAILIFAVLIFAVLYIDLQYMNDQMSCKCTLAKSCKTCLHKS